MKNKFLFKSLVLLGLIANVQASETYTIDELILISLKNAPELKISELNYEAAQQEHKISNADYLPKVDMQASVSKIGSSSIVDNNTMKEDTLLMGTLSLKQIVYDFGKTGSTSDFTKYESQGAAFSNIQKISDKKREVKEAYYNVLKAKSLINVQRENVKLNQAQLYRSQQYFKAGIRTKIDISDAKVALIRSQIDLKNAQYNLKLAYALLDKAVGFVSLDTDYKVYATKLNLNTLANHVKSYDLSLKDSIEFAYMNKPAIKEYETKTKGTKALTDVSSAEYYPALFLDAGYTKQKLDKYQVLSPEDQWQVGINLSWNLYQGGASSAKVQKSQINASVSNFALRELKLQVKKQVTFDYLNLNRKKDTLALSQSLMVVSSQKFDQAGKRYEHGLSDYIELQQARQGYIDAKALLIVDYYNYYIAIANLDNAIGK